MNISYTPGRGFFIGKISIYLLTLAVAIVMLYPSPINADALPLAMMPSHHNSSITALPGSNSLTIKAKSSLTWITAYASVPEETSDHPFLTASGNLVRDGIVAANFLPFGTRIQIPALFGSKIFIVEDRMNERFSKRVDIWMPTVDNAVDFGIRHAKIVIVDSLHADLAEAK